MTEQLERAKDGERPVGWRLTAALMALFWERLWPALSPGVGVALLFAGLSFLNFWVLFPGWVHLILLVLFGVALVAALIRDLRHLTLPRRKEGHRRLEHATGLDHRPLAALRDQLAVAPGASVEAGTQTLWEEHRRRTRRKLRFLRVGWPAGGLARKDPWALRAGVGLLLVIGLVVAGGDGPRRLGHAFAPDLSIGTDTEIILDAWITPPTYTGLAPTFLSKVAKTGQQTIRVPAGSEFFARVHGGRNIPDLVIDGGTTAFKEIDRENFEIERTMTAGKALSIEQDGDTLAAWSLDVVADAAPSIAFHETPSPSARDALRLTYDASDDYGLVSVEARLRRVEGSEVMTFDLPLAAEGRTEASETSFRDLTPHPWAGLPVIIQLAARDELDQEGVSEEIEIILPEREFRHPVAKAIVEQRRVLAIAPSRQDAVARTLSRISGQPQNYYGDVVAFMSLRSAVWRLVNLAPSDEIVGEVVDLLWDTALRIEDGDLSLAEAELRAAQDALLEALANNATDAEIDDLIQDVREALERFLEALAERALADARDGNLRQPIDPNALLGAEELQALLDRAQELSRTGSRDAARELLSQLRELLENLRNGVFAGEMDEGALEGSQTLSDLNELLQQQQELLDRTFRESQRRRPGQRGRRGQPEGQEPGQAADGLSEDQEALRRMLGELMRRLGEGGGNIPGALGRAERFMDNARRQLEARRPGDAVGPQTNALDQLRQGADSVIRDMLQALGQNPGLDEGPGQFNRVGRDPLGRPQAGLGAIDDESVKIPDEADVQRAREILRELYRRSGDRSRPPIERDYIDRLLRRF